VTPSALAHKCEALAGADLARDSDDEFAKRLRELMAPDVTLLVRPAVGRTCGIEEWFATVQKASIRFSAALIGIGLVVRKQALKSGVNR